MKNRPTKPRKNEGTAATEDLCREILSVIEPSAEDIEKIRCLTDKLQGRIAEIVKEEGLDIGVSVEGSFAKETWIREEVDVDIFLLFPNTVSRQRFESLALAIAEEALAPNETRRRFTEHPYLEAVIEGVRVNIVPAYRVQKGHWRSATDRTPFHTQYVKQNLGAEKRREVRLLKKFMKGIGVYGAEIRVGGFSGYLSEMFILNYGTFLDTVRSVAEWHGRPMIDIERHYDEVDEVERIFPEPLVVIDPVDKRRNVASAVTLEKLSEFVAACREFLRQPHKGFFIPEEEALSEDRLLQTLAERGTHILFIHVNGLSITPDVLWGQLYKSLKATCRILAEGGFHVLRSTVWSEEKEEAVFCIELESGTISRTKEQVGPFVWSDEALTFIEKHLGSPETAYGPWIDGDRWMVRVKRDSYNVADLVRGKIGSDLDNIGLGSKVRAAVKAGYTLMVEEEILPLYSKNRCFARHLTSFLEGVPAWLRVGKAS